MVAGNRSPDATDQLVAEGARGYFSLEEAATKLTTLRIRWLMLPAGPVIDEHSAQLAGVISPGDIIVGDGNACYKDDLHRSKGLEPTDSHDLDAGSPAVTPLWKK